VTFVDGLAVSVDRRGAPSTTKIPDGGLHKSFMFMALQA